MTGGEMIRDFRVRAGLTQDEVGMMLDKSGQWMGRVERGLIFMTPRLIKEIVEILGHDTLQPLLQKAFEEDLARRGIDAEVKVTCRV